MRYNDILHRLTTKYFTKSAMLQLVIVTHLNASSVTLHIIHLNRDITEQRIRINSLP